MLEFDNFDRINVRDFFPEDIFIDIPIIIQFPKSHGNSDYQSLIGFL
jgi:hypothetical protein